MIALLTGNWKVLLYIAIAAAVAYGIHRYNDSVRAPLEREIKFLTDSIESNKKTAESMLVARDIENKQLKERYDADAKQKDADYAKLLARFNSRGPVGVREFTGCGNGSGTTGQATTTGAGTPEKPASEPRTTDEVRELVLTEAAVGQVLQWYAYGQSCHKFVTAQ